MVFYLVLPLDLVPDFIPVLGQIDDVVVGLAGFTLFFKFMPRQVLDELIAREEALERPASSG